MPFAVFRKHQKKMLVVFGILAMLGFVLSDTLYRLGNNGGGRNANPVVVELYGKPVRRMDLELMANRRAKANRFLFPLTRIPDFFGGLGTRDLVDAILLEKEADRLGVPNDAELAKSWLTRVTDGKMNQAQFETLLSLMGRDVDPDEILVDLASQLRLRQAQQLLGNPLVTPLDVFQTYRDQNERGNYKVLTFPVANYTDKVGEPTAGDIAALYDKYKDALPDPSSETPGFKIPRQVKVEILSADVTALAKQIEAKLTDADLRAYYENHKAELTPPKELPDDLFANDKEGKLTPAIYRPFSEVRDTIVASLARERAQEEVTAKFDKIRDDVVVPFADSYHAAQADIEEAKKLGETPTAVVPAFNDLGAIAKENNLTWETSPALTLLDAENYGQISSSSVGSSPSFDDPKFAEVVFDEKNLLYDALEFSDLAGRRYLVRKVADTPPHIAPLDDVRPKVIAAWKMEKARELAQKAASEALAKLKSEGGVIKEQVVLGRPVISIEGATRRRIGMPVPGAFMQYGDSVPSDLPQIPLAGDKLREALFSLNPGEVALEANSPKDTYYVLTLARRDPAVFTSLYGPTTSPFPYMDETFRTATRAQVERWMKRLREQAGMPDDWTPPGEVDRTTRKA